MNLYLIRHARQNSTLCNIDVSLSSEGLMQAKLLGKRLMNYQIDALYSSDLKRAVETAEIINQYLNLPHIIKKELREISFGALEGHTVEYINKNFADFLEERDMLISDIPYPDGESGQDVCNRMLPIIQEITMSNYENVVIVTHGNAIRALLANILNLELAKRSLFSHSLENCSITELQYCKENDRFYLERLNDYAHIEVQEHLLRRNWIQN